MQSTDQLPDEIADEDIDWLPTMVLPALSAGLDRDVSAMATAQLVAVRVKDTTASAARSIVSSSLVQGVGKLLTYVAAIAVMTLITRLLDVNAYGDYIIIITIFSLVQLVAQAGTTRIGVREVAKFPEQADSIVSATITLRILTTVVIYGLTAIGAQFLPYSHEVKLATVIIAASFILLSTAMGLDVVFLPRLTMVAAVLADFANEIFMVLALAALFIYLRAHPAHPLTPQMVFYLVVGITAFANVLTFLVRWIGAHRLMKIRLHIEPRHWRYLLSLSIPMAVVGVMDQVQYRADAFIISLMRPEHDIAVYGLAVKTMDVVLTVPVVLIGTVFPVLARYAHQDNQRFNRAVQRVFDGSMALAAPIVLMLILFAPDIIYILGSGKLPESTLPLQILSVSALFNFFSTLYANLVVIYNRQASLIWTYVVNIAINVGLNILLIPHYSYLGSAAITVLTECLRLITVIIVAARVFTFSPRLGIVPKTLLACVAMAAAVLGLEALSLIHSPIILIVVAGAAGGACYGLVLFLVGGIDDAVIKMAQSKIPGLRRRVAPARIAERSK